MSRKADVVQQTYSNSTYEENLIGNDKNDKDL